MLVTEMLQIQKSWKFAKKTTNIWLPYNKYIMNDYNDYKWLWNKCSDRNIELKLPTLLGNYDRQNDEPTNHPTNQQTNMRVQREVTLPRSKSSHKRMGLCLRGKHTYKFTFYVLAGARVGRRLFHKCRIYQISRNSKFFWGKIMVCLFASAVCG